MIKNGKGGAKTNKNGLRFERIVDVKTALEKNGWLLKETKISDKIYELDYEEQKIFILQKHQLYTYIGKYILNFDHKDYISKKLLPDNAIINVTTKTVIILEVKFQSVAGSVDEKLQTCDFKKKQYEKLARDTNYKIRYVYILNDFFDDEKYKDVLEYIKKTNCEYYFNEFPLEEIFRKNEN